jgi:hypothetical protein
VFGTDDGFVLRFVYQVVVPKALAPKELVSIFEGKEKTVLPPWDPMVRSFLLISLFWINSTFLSRVLLHDNDILGLYTASEICRGFISHFFFDSIHHMSIIES